MKKPSNSADRIVHHALSQQEEDEYQYHHYNSRPPAQESSPMMVNSSSLMANNDDQFESNPHTYGFDDEVPRPSDSNLNQKQQLTREEFLDKLQEHREKSQSILKSRVLVLIGITMLFGVGLYMKFSLGTIPFHAGDGDDDKDNHDFTLDIIESDILEGEVVGTMVAGESQDTKNSSKCEGTPTIKNMPTSTTTTATTRDQNGVSFDPSASFNQHDPLKVDTPDWYGGVFINPPHPSLRFDNDSVDEGISSNNVGYIQHPDIFNDTVVFCSEGDVYLTMISEMKERLDSSNIKPQRNSALAAMRLTSTVGNVNSPKINPKYPFLVAFTATYTGHREVYLMDLRSNYRSNPSLRLTYTDSNYGILSISGWEDNGTTLVVSSFNLEVAMEDVRLYKIGVVFKEDRKNDNNRSQRKNIVTESTPHSVSVSSITPVPLSQAIDSTVDEETGCRYFTRYKQSSNTVRYVGGTAENLWAYCGPDETLAVPLTDDYNGTSKAPQIYSTKNGPKYLLFLSDRSISAGNEWKPSTMNLWAAHLPNKNRLYGNKNKSKMSTPIQLSKVSCQFGMYLQEFAIDKSNGNVILRIGADLYIVTASELEKLLSTQSLSMTSNIVNTSHLPIAVYSDFHNLHERLIPIENPYHVTSLDIFGTSYGTISALMTARGQVFVNPVVPDTTTLKPYGGGGMNMPHRRYRVAPGSLNGGMLRIYGSWYIPSSGSDNPKALVLATDPLSPTAEMAFYVLDVAAASAMSFGSTADFPTPLIGGHLNGGSVKDGGLGSISSDTVIISPCGRRVAWTDTDGRIVVMSLSLTSIDDAVAVTLPQTNNIGQPMKGIDASITFSPGGRYLAIEHSARNQFRVITIGDLGDPNDGQVRLNQFVQATLDRFNSMQPLWGRSPLDFQSESNSPAKATTLFFLTDRDVLLTQNTSPWGSRAPQPYFAKKTLVYALPLLSESDETPLEEMYGGNFVGGGAAEILLDRVAMVAASIDGQSSAADTEASVTTGNRSSAIDTEDSSTTSESNESEDKSANINKDIEISFMLESDKMAFARRAYILSEVPASEYIFIHQLEDDASLILAEKTNDGVEIAIFAYGSFPENSMDKLDVKTNGITFQSIGVSTDRRYMHLTYSGRTKVFANKASDFMSIYVNDLENFGKNIVDTADWFVSVWPKLEYQQMYSDAWRMLRDFYYDPQMGNVDWSSVHGKYLPLVNRCGKREELDDVLKQMSSELSALHVFVYGGEYNEPLRGDFHVLKANKISSLGALLERSIEWGGYVIKDIPQNDPDFNPIDDKMIYSPLSERTLRMSGQRGLLPGDVIIGVNGEAVLNVPDINALLRGMAGRSIRLDVLRVKSMSEISSDVNLAGSFEPEPLIVVPLSLEGADNLRYAAWEWKTRNHAKILAEEHGFTVGYMHLRSMSGAEGEDAFVRGFYPDYDKQALIIDVRHNRGGNIDSWLLEVLQRKAWMYWQGRATNITTGGLGWDEQYAFRGHVVVLMDEKTSSDGEGFSRGVSELGLGKLVGSRTWGGGIWLSSDNKLVDGGIATAPEIGTYNANFGWGMGIEQMGVTPDFIVDNNPRETYGGRDAQLEKALSILKEWLEDEPIVVPNDPGSHQDMSLKKEIEGCSAL